MLDNEREVLAVLVSPDEYTKAPNNVASVTTSQIIFIKRKEFAIKPYEVVDFPINECSSINYEIKWAIFPVVMGVFLIALIGYIFFSLFTYGIPPEGLHFPIGAILVTSLFGYRLFTSPKRHHLTFVINEKKYKWQSKAGDYKYKTAAVENIINFAKSKSIFNLKL